MGTVVYIDTHTSYLDSPKCVINLGEKDKLIIGSAYRSPNTSVNFNLNIEITEVINLKLSQLLITGYFNFKEINWNTHFTNVNNENLAYVFFITTYQPRIQI